MFLRSDDATRFIRLRPLTQLMGILGMTTVLGWTLVASAVLVIDTVSAGSSRDQMLRTQTAFEERLTQLSQERDIRATEAATAQTRFSAAVEQVSQMQSQLLTSEEGRRELQDGLSAVQSSLRSAIGERDDAQRVAGLKDDPEARGIGSDEVSVALDIMTGELRQAATERAAAQRSADAAQSKAQELAVERDQILAQNDEILAQLESAVTFSSKPLDDVFRSIGMDPDEVLQTIRSGYSGQGGPLTPSSYSTRGDASLSSGRAKANEIMITLDKMNTYRIAIEKMPLTMPLRDAFRYTSGFGARWGRRHEGVDMATPVGTPVYATADGVINFAGRQGAYGNLIKIDHELGTETRFGHLSRIRVKAGQRVSQGDLIGDSGNTGRSTGPHLHYEVRMKGRAMDPMTFIKAASNVF